MFEKTRAGWFLLLALFSLWALNAQVTSGGLSGNVFDTSGSVVPDVKIVLTNSGTGIAHATASDTTGRYEFPFLPPGEYQIEAEKNGFSGFRQRGILVRVSMTTRLDLSLAVGEVKSVVEVRSETPVLQMEHASLGNVVEEAQIRQLPLNGRNAFSLINLTAGSSLNDGSGVQSSINGGRIQTNKVLLDGVQINQEYSGGSGGGGIVFAPELDSVREFNVITNMYSAEFGRILGGVVTVNLKSGSNEFHGSVFEYWRNTLLEARSFFNTTGVKPRFFQHQFGGSAGGPVRKNKVFFFGSYQGTRNVQPSQGFITVPAPQMLKGDFSALLPRQIFDPQTTQADTLNRLPFAGNLIPASRLNRVAVAAGPFWPLPNGSGTVNNFFTAFANRATNNSGTGRIDYRLRDADQMYFRLTLQDNFTLNGSAFPPGNVANPNLPHTWSPNLSFQVNETHIFRPTFINEFRFGFLASSFHQDGPLSNEYTGEAIGIPKNSDRETGFPVLAPSGFQQLGAIRPRILYAQQSWQWDDTVSYLRGGHSLKFGGQVRHLAPLDFLNNRPAPSYTFSGFYTNQPSNSRLAAGNSMADFMLGTPVSIIQIRQEAPMDTRSNEIGLYAQDDFRLSRRLTLNLGARWDFFGAPNEIGGNITTYDPKTNSFLRKNPPAHASRRLFGPRAGVTYLVTGRTVIRTGYGISYFPQLQGVQSSWANNDPPFITQHNFSNTGSFASTYVTGPYPLGAPLPGFAPITLPFPADATLTGAFFPERIPHPYVQMWNLTVQRRVAGDTSVELSYVGDKGTHLDTGFGSNMNQLPPALNGPDSLFGGRTIQQRLPYPGVGSIVFYANLGDATYHALQATARWRNRHGIWLQAAYTHAKALSDFSGRGSAGNSTRTFNNQPRDWTNLRLDKGIDAFSLRHALVLNYGLELPFGPGKPYLRTGGWRQLIVAGWQASGILTLRTGFPFSVNSNTGGQGWPNRLCNGNLDAAQRSLSRWFDTGCFVLPSPTYSLGNAGVDILESPGFRNLDLSLFKRFYVHERKNLEFRSDFFNSTNTPHFGTPSRFLDAADFGRVSSASGSRIIQLALRFTY